MVTNYEQSLLVSAVDNAISFGLGDISAAKDQMSMAGIDWREEFEQFIFEYRQLLKQGGKI